MILVFVNNPLTKRFPFLVPLSQPFCFDALAIYPHCDISNPLNLRLVLKICPTHAVLCQGTLCTALSVLDRILGIA